VTEVVGSVDGAVPVEIRVVQGNPAQVLAEQASEADLLMVGHRGLGGFASACLGSVGLQCVLHAACPVVVVPLGARRPCRGDEDRGDGGDGGPGMNGETDMAVTGVANDLWTRPFVEGVDDSDSACPVVVTRAGRE
jgi:hypothetical protein